MSKSCSYNLSPLINLIINIILHVLILFAFLSVLYFSLIAPMSKNAFEYEISNQVKNTITTQLQDIKKKSLSDNMNNYIDDVINYSNENDEYGKPVYVIDNIIKEVSKEDPQIKEHNKWIMFVSVSIIVILILGLIIYITTLSQTCCKETDIGNIIKENFITFIFVGLVEYLFFTQVAFKYVPAPPSLLVSSVINKFKDTL